MTNDETLIVGAAWGSWHPDCPTGMVVVCASPGGRLAEARRHFAVPAAEYAARGESRFTIDTARHAEVFGFQGTGSAKAPPALERTATGRLAMLMRTFGSGASQPARESESGQAKPWGEVLQKLGFAKKAGSPGAATCEVRKSTTRPASSPARPEPEQTAPAARALPWAEIIAEVEAEGRPAR
jgi:hypothetical protein